MARYPRIPHIKHYRWYGMLCAKVLGGHPKEQYLIGNRDPNYPVPAIRAWNEISAPHGGGVEGDCRIVGATFVDWSRGYIDIW